VTLKTEEMAAEKFSSAITGINTFKNIIKLFLTVTVTFNLTG